jgi:hypothetical protein
MRCRCCDVPLTWRDIKIKQDDNSEEDFCSKCLSIVYDIDSYEPKTYVFEDLCNEFYIPEQYIE